MTNHWVEFPAFELEISNQTCLPFNTDFNQKDKGLVHATGGQKRFSVQQVRNQLEMPLKDFQSFTERKLTTKFANFMIQSDHMPSKNT